MRMLGSAVARVASLPFGKAMRGSSLRSEMTAENEQLQLQMQLQ
jgi:hypothetical protein